MGRNNNNNNSNNNDYETSWADQWDPEPSYGSSNNINNGYVSKNKDNKNNNGGTKKKVEEGVAKTKEVATNGFKKIKHGTSLGFGWIKDKYHKTTQKE